MKNFKANFKRDAISHLSSLAITLAIALQSSADPVMYGANAGKEMTGYENIAVGNYALAYASGTNNTAIGNAAGYDAQSLMRNIFIGHRAGNLSTNLVGCIAIGTGELSESGYVTNTISIGGKVVVSDDFFFITPERRRHTLFAPVFWVDGNFVLSADKNLILSCPSNVVIKAGHGVYLEGVKSCDWTPRMVFEDGALQVYTNGVKVGTIPLQQTN